MIPDDVFGGNDDDLNILECTPEPDAKIEDIAKAVVKMMKTMKADGAEIIYPDFKIEVDKTASAKDIIDAYRQMQPKIVDDLRGPPARKPLIPPPKFGGGF